MDFIDEEHVIGLEVGEDCGEVGAFGEDRAAGGAEANAELVGDDMGDGGFAQARRAVEEDVVKRLAPGFGSGDENAEVFAQFLLAGEVTEGLWAEGWLV